MGDPDRDKRPQEARAQKEHKPNPKPQHPPVQSLPASLGFRGRLGLESALPERFLWGSGACGSIYGGWGILCIDLRADLVTVVLNATMHFTQSVQGVVEAFETIS